MKFAGLRPLIGALILIFSTPALAQQGADSSRVKIKKQFTITFEEQVKLRKSKRVPRLKIVHIRPERNPILYDKIAFVNSLNIRPKQSFKDVFPYPVFWGELSGGTEKFLNARAGVQINGGKIIPSLFWKWTQFDAENSQTTRSDILFSGGVRLPLSNRTGFDLNLYHRQIKNEDNNFLKNRGLDSLLALNKNTITRIDVSNDSRFHNLTVRSRMSFTDYRQDYRQAFHYTYSRMDLDAGWNPGRLFVNVSSALTLTRNENVADDTDFTTATARFSGGYKSAKTTVEAGAEFFAEDRIINDRNKNRVAPYVRLEQQFLPGILSARVTWSGEYAHPQPADLLEVNPYAVFRSIHPDIVSENLEAAIQFTPSKTVSARAGFARASYDVLNVWQADTSTGFYRYEALDVNDTHISRFFLSGTVDVAPVMLQAGMEHKFYSLGSSLSELPLLSRSDLFFLGRFTRGRFTGQADIRFVGKRSSDGQEEDMEGVTLVNASLRTMVKKPMSIFISGRNLLNKTWTRNPSFREPGMIVLTGLRFSW